MNAIREFLNSLILTAIVGAVLYQAAQSGITINPVQLIVELIQNLH